MYKIIMMILVAASVAWGQQVHIDSAYGDVKDTVERTDTLTLYGSGYGTEGMSVLKNMIPQILIDSSDTILKCLVIPVPGEFDSVFQFTVVNSTGSMDSIGVYVKTFNLPDSIFLDSISILSMYVQGTFSDTIDSVSNATISNVTDSSLVVTFTTPLTWDNSNDTIQFWINTQNFIRNYYLTLPPIIDSIRPNPWYRNKRFSTYGKDLNFVDTVFLNTTSLNSSESKLSNQIIDTIPLTIPRGKQPLRLIYDIDNILNIKDTIIDTLNVFIPRTGW